MTVDPRTPCIVGVGTHTWHPADTGAAGAPEPFAMWETVTRHAEADAGVSLIPRLDSVDVVYCQTWQYDDPTARFTQRLGITPRRAAYSGIGGTTPQVLVQEAAARLWRGELDVALVVGAEALDTQRRFKKAGERFPYSYRPELKPEFPWEASFHPAEVAHEAFQAWLTFALFDVARRGHLGTDVETYRAQLGEQWHRFTTVAAANPEAWFPIERTAEEIITPTAENRMVGSPYTKYMVSIMDVDMAAAIFLTTDGQADALGIPRDQRVYLRGWHFATDATYVAEHPDLWQSPAMRAVTATAFDHADIGIDDIAHLDLYSCFGSSVNFMRDALELTSGDSRALTVTGGLPYHGGAGSDYLTHAIAHMVRTLRHDPGSYGLVTGVGMHMTKHVAGVYSTEPGTVRVPGAGPPPATVPIVDRYAGDATVASVSVVHGREGATWGLVVADLAEREDRARCYCRIEDADLLADAEHSEWIGRRIRTGPHPDRPDVNMVLV
ncbi:MAG: acetyl-CoA synthetase [Acidimicrobiia bacterium]|nr:acetyl-CoA synthetase [Acidimicrobiia bacterium]